MKLGEKSLEGFLLQWYPTLAGQRFVEDLQRVVTPLLESRFGYYALQIGGESLGNGLLDLSRINNRLLIGRADGVSIVSLSETLPLATDSSDLVILPNTLELSADPHAVLREVERVLVPDGTVIIIGIDPWTLWGVTRSLRPGWQGRLYSQRRIRDWLELLGLEPDRCDSVSMLQLRHRELAGVWSKADKLFNLLGAHIHGSYVVTARKRVTKMTPIKTRWRARPRLAGGALLKPAAREIKRAGD